MDISVRLNGVLAQRVGRAQLQVMVDDDATVADLIHALAAAYPVLDGRIDAAIPFIGGQHATRDAALSAGQEVALLMPVAGG